MTSETKAEVQGERMDFNQTRQTLQLIKENMSPMRLQVVALASRSKIINYLAPAGH